MCDTVSGSTILQYLNSFINICFFFQDLFNMNADSSSHYAPGDFVDFPTNDPLLDIKTEQDDPSVITTPCQVYSETLPYYPNVDITTLLHVLWLHLFCLNKSSDESGNFLSENLN